MTAEQRLELARCFGVARRRLVAADELVEVVRVGTWRRWGAVLADSPTTRLEQQDAAALDGDDADLASEAIALLERAATRPGPA